MGIQTFQPAKQAGSEVEWTS